MNDILDPGNKLQVQQIISANLGNMLLRQSSFIRRPNWKSETLDFPLSMIKAIKIKYQPVISHSN